jgi:hypothetical protein
LHGLGYVEGKNVAYEARFAEAKMERLPDLAAELVRLKVDVVVAQGGLAIVAARQATSTIPRKQLTDPSSGSAGARGARAR